MKRKLPPAGFEPTSQAVSGGNHEKPICLAGLHYGGNKKIINNCTQFLKHSLRFLEHIKFFKLYIQLRFYLNFFNRVFNKSSYFASAARKDGLSCSMIVFPSFLNSFNLFCNKCFINSLSSFVRFIRIASEIKRHGPDLNRDILAETRFPVLRIWLKRGSRAFAMYQIVPPWLKV